MEFVKYKQSWYQVVDKQNEEKAELLSMKNKTVFANIKGLETCVAEDFSMLDWTNSVILNNNYETGWLSPEGKFYGCDYEHHAAQAYFVHKCFECDLERKGFIKLTYVDRRAKRLVALYNKIDNKYFITPKQYNFLSKTAIENFDTLTFFYRLARKNENENNDTNELTM